MFPVALDAAQSWEAGAYGNHIKYTLDLLIRTVLRREARISCTPRLSREGVWPGKRQRHDISH